MNGLPLSFSTRIAFVAILALSVACSFLELSETQKGESPDPLERELELVASWYLTTRDSISPRISYLADLPESLALHGIALSALPWAEFRLDTTNWIRTKWVNGAGYMRDQELFEVGQLETTLKTHVGLEADSFKYEVLGSKIWLEALTGRACPTYAYSNHIHTRSAMEALDGYGYLAARDGQPGRYPWASSLLGATNDSIWLKSWQYVPMWEVPLTFTCQEIQDLDPSEISAWLGREEHLPRWKVQGTWINLYTHTDDPATGTPRLDGLHLAALLDALLEDGDTWIAPLGEVAASLRGTHRPDSAEPLVWRPLAITGVPDREGPWAGKSCAFSFSTDDGWKANLYSYAPVFHERGLAYTAYINPRKVINGDGGSLLYMSSSELMEMANLGIEIGSHGFEHMPLMPTEVCTVDLAEPDSDPMHMEIVTQRGLKVLNCYRELPIQ